MNLVANKIVTVLISSPKILLTFFPVQMQIQTQIEASQ